MFLAGEIFTSDEAHGTVGQIHQTVNQTLLHQSIRLRRDHVADSFVKGVNLYCQLSGLWRLCHFGGAHLLRCQIDSDAVQRSQDLVNERLVLACLLHDKVSSALLSDLDERVARHVLDTCHVSGNKGNAFELVM
jgi:hypothetical protein